MSEKLLTNSVYEYIRTRDWPQDLILHIEEEPFNLQLSVYRDNWITLTGEEQLQAAMMVKEVMEALRGQGIPIYMGAIRSQHEQ